MGEDGAVRSVLADVAAALVLLTVLPLALLQLPDAIAWAIPARFAAAGPAAEASLLRASGLALVAMAVAAPLGGLAVRRFRAWPVLVTGLGIAAVADVLGGARATVVTVGVDRCLHGAGAGMAIAAATALAAERGARAGERGERGGGADRPKGGRSRVLAGCWATCAVLGLAAAPGVMRYRLASGDWHAALRPYPWLTGVALGVAALYALLARTPVPPGARGDFPSAERTQLALLAVPVTGMCAVAVAVTFGHRTAVTAGATAAALSLAGLAVMTARTSGAGWFAVVCAAVGFTLAPAAGALGDVLTKQANLSPYAITIAAISATAVAVAVSLPDRFTGLVVATGCTCAGAGFVIGGFPDNASVQVVCALVVGGSAAALTAAWRRVSVSGAICGAVLLLAGSLAGYLADGAIELRALNADAAASGEPLLAAASQWFMIAAIVMGCLALTQLALTQLASGQAKVQVTVHAKFMKRPARR